MAIFCTQYSPYSFNFYISASYPGALEPSLEQKMKKTKTTPPPKKKTRSVNYCQMLVIPRPLPPRNACLFQKSVTVEQEVGQEFHTEYCLSNESISCFDQRPAEASGASGSLGSELLDQH